MKNITIPKKLIVKSFIHIGIAGVLAGLYVHEVKKQVEVNDLKDSQIAVSAKAVEEFISTTYNNFSGAFLSLIKKAEGFSDIFYPDNKGFAIGFGYNPSQNDDASNKNILDYAKVDEETQKKILDNSKQYKNLSSSNVPETLKGIKLTPEQINKMALYSQQTYERDFVFVLSDKLAQRQISSQEQKKLVEKYYQLPENQRSVLTHMAYKVGRGGLAKYNTFFKDFIVYLQDPTLEHQQAVADDFVYHYKKNGAILSDTRVSDMHKKLFMAKPTVTKTIQTKVVTAPSTPKKELTQEEKYARAIQDVRNKMTLSNLVQYIKDNQKANEKLMISQRAKQQQRQQEIAQTNSAQPQQDDDGEYEDNVEYYEDLQSIINMASQSNSYVSITINGKKIK